MIEAGADGVSVISAISQAENIQLAAKRIRESISIYGTENQIVRYLVKKPVNYKRALELFMINGFFIV